jgi:hypothetical protein
MFFYACFRNVYNDNWAYFVLLVMKHVKQTAITILNTNFLRRQVSIFR